MAILRNQPYRTKRFLVDLGDGQDREFAEVILPEARVEVIEYREGGEKTGFAHKLVGRADLGTLVLRRGYEGSLELYQWFQQAVNDPENVRRNVLVKLVSEDGASVVTAWKLRNAWPIAHRFSTLDAHSCETLFETLEVACESIEME